VTFNQSIIITIHSPRSCLGPSLWCIGSWSVLDGAVWPGVIVAAAPRSAAATSSKPVRAISRPIQSYQSKR
jgi:hypothetical protein